MQQNIYMENIFLNPESIKYNKSLLKSAVQKCVRRGLSDQAVRLAKASIHKDITDYARRLMIIVLEDVVLHPQFDELAEITKKVSKKNGKEEITSEELNTLLQVTYDIADSKFRDSKINNPDNIEDSLFNGELGEKEQKLVDAIEYRSKIGGMKGDILFLQLYVRVWNYRFSNGFKAEDLWKFFQTEKKIKWSEVDDMTPSDIPLVAVDMHSFPPIKRLLLKKPHIKKYLYEDMQPIHHLLDFKDDDQLISLVMWFAHISENYKKVFWKNPPQEFNGMEEELGASVEEQEIIKSFNNIAMKEIESIAQWFIRKQSER